MLKSFTKYFVGRGVLKVIEIVRDGGKNEHKKVTKLDFRVKQPQSSIRVVPEYGSSAAMQTSLNCGSSIAASPNRHFWRCMSLLHSKILVCKILVFCNMRCFISVSCYRSFSFIFTEVEMAEE